MAIPVPQAEAKGHTQEDDSKLNAIPDVRFIIHTTVDVLQNLPAPEMEEMGMITFPFPFLQASGEAHGIWKMTFYTPEPVSMVLREAEQAGYGAMTTSSRLVMRSPYNTAETYSEDVSNTPSSPVVPLCCSL